MLDDNDLPDSDTLLLSEYRPLGKVLFQNVRSLNKNYESIKDLAHKDLICLGMSEIWHPKQPFEKIPNFHKLIKWVRTDPNCRRDSNLGGGVGLFINEGIKFQELPTKSVQGCIEIIGIKLLNHNTDILNIYRPPGGDISIFLDVLQFNLNLLTSKNKILGGDFNIDFSKSINNQANKLDDLCEQHSMGRVVNGCTRVSFESATSIDTIYCNNSGSTGEIIVTDVSDHHAVAIDTHISISSAKTYRPMINNYSRNNILKLKEALKHENWDNITDYDSFYARLLIYINNCCPKSLAKEPNNNVLSSFITKGILISRKTKLTMKKNLNKGNISRQQWVYYRNIYNKVIRLSKRMTLEKDISNNWGNSRKIWQLTNGFVNRTKCNPTIIENINVNGEVIDNKKQIANHFNTHFSTIGANLANKHIPGNYLKYLDKKPTSMNFNPVTEADIAKIIKEMKQKRSMGHDGLSNFVIKAILPEICKVLTTVINTILDSGTFPHTLKIAKVLPLFKKGKKEDLNNYRPISILPTISKIVEKVIEKQIREYMDSYGYFYQHQFGFRAGHETGHAVSKLVNIIASNSYKHSSIIMCDLKKAFDTVPHKKLIKKIEKYGIDTTLLTSYLHNRSQYTELDGHKSLKLNLNFGVPQGSVLGPLLFLLYINDLPLAVNFETILFADDTNFISINMDNETINAEMKKAEKWFSTNGLTIHPEKTALLNMKVENLKLFVSGIEIKEVQSAKYVGITIDNKLDFKKHALEAIAKVKQNMFLLNSNKNYLPFSIRKLIYNSLIKPYFEYGVENWGHAGKKHINILQKKCIRMINNKQNYVCHTNELFYDNRLLKFEDIIEFRKVRYMWKDWHGQLCEGMSCFDKNEKTTNLRFREDYVIPKHNKRAEHIMSVSGPKIWNSLPLNVKSKESITAFKYAFLKHKLDNYAQIPQCTIKNCISCASGKPF